MFQPDSIRDGVPSLTANNYQRNKVPTRGYPLARPVDKSIPPLPHLDFCTEPLHREFFVDPMVRQRVLDALAGHDVGHRRRPIHFRYVVEVLSLYFLEMKNHSPEFWDELVQLMIQRQSKGQSGVVRAKINAANQRRRKANADGQS